MLHWSPVPSLYVQHVSQKTKSAIWGIYTFWRILLTFSKRTAAWCLASCWVKPQQGVTCIICDVQQTLNSCCLVDGLTKVPPNWQMEHLVLTGFAENPEPIRLGRTSHLWLCCPWAWACRTLQLGAFRLISLFHAFLPKEQHCRVWTQL